VPSWTVEDDLALLLASHKAPKRPSERSSVTPPRPVGRASDKRSWGKQEAPAGWATPKPFRAKWLSKKPPREWSGDGFDTETFQGWARLLCTSEEHLLVRRGAWEKCFDFLLDNGPVLAAWNLRFDVEAVLKHLPRDAIIRLLIEEHLNVGKYSVDIVPWKMFRVRDADRKTEVYDTAPFYGSKLDVAAKRFLGEGKLGVDAAALNVDPDAWSPKKLPRVISYCKRDAWLTKRLTEEVSERFVKLGGDFKKPYSVAFVAADILMRETHIPKLPDAMVPIADDAFFGARFECIQRGRFPDAHAYDIKSAYPGHMRTIEDASGRWVEGVHPHKDALHAVVDCTASVPQDDYPILAPLPAKRHGVVIFPTGTFTTRVLLPTFEKFRALLTPVRSWSLIPEGKIFRPYGPTVDRLLAFREASDDLLKDAAKRGANSLYGKLLNQRFGTKLVADEGADSWTAPTVLLDGVPHRMERLKSPGLLYNSLHGGLVTEACRLQIWDACQKRLDSVLMIQADGILASRPFLGKKKAKVAGDLGYVAGGDAVVCGSGLYEIRGYARRTRGVMLRSEAAGKTVKAKLKGPSWFGLLRGKRGETVRFVDRRPAHLSECVKGSRYAFIGGELRQLGLKDTNVFHEFPRDLNVVRDKKRVWPEGVEARDLLRTRVLSEPLSLSQ
jgi:hypothetical protein